MRFKNRVAIVTGAAAGIGKAVAAHLAREGAQVVAVDYDAQALAQLVQEFSCNGWEVTDFVGDVSNEAWVQAIVQQVQNIHGRIDILVNNAGIWRENSGEFAQSDSAVWRKKIDVNILGTMYFTRAVINGMLNQRYGRIINVASVAGVYGIRTMADYSMTRASLRLPLHWPKVAEHHVTVNAVLGQLFRINKRKEQYLSYMPVGTTDANVILHASEEAAMSGRIIWWMDAGLRYNPDKSYPSNFFINNTASINCLSTLLNLHIPRWYAYRRLPCPGRPAPGCWPARQNIGAMRWLTRWGDSPSDCRSLAVSNSCRLASVAERGGWLPGESAWCWHERARHRSEFGAALNSAGPGRTRRAWAVGPALSACRR